MRTCRAVAVGKLNAMRAGAAATLMAALLPVVILLAGFAVNFAYMQLVRTETFVATDSATRAAGRTYALTGDLGKAKANARTAAEKNSGVSAKLSLSDADFLMGTSVRDLSGGKYAFTAGGKKPNSLQVTLNRHAGGLNGPAPLLMPGLLGVSDFGVAKASISTLVDVDIAFVVDRSGSMAYSAKEKAQYPPLPASAPSGWWFGKAAPPDSRWRDLVAASDVFLQELGQAAFVAHVALVTYGDTAYLDQKMTGDLTTIKAGLDKYTKNLNSAQTNIGHGLQIGQGSLGDGRPYASKVVVLFTDGIRTAGPDPVPIATDIGKKGIVVFTVTFSNEADKTTMGNVATAGLGKSFHAHDASSLATVFETIARSLPTILTK